ncbi:MAG: IS4 family transposase [Deltaproteobacteria bacterium]|nr:IS4 family transposase [Deltaproteobacteria bacterium]
MMEVAMVQAVFMDVFSWNRARINFLSNFIVALLKVKTVNLVEIATAFSGRAKKDSKYRRIKRFFQSFQVDAFTIACLISQLLPIREATWVLAMDRTNWKLGKEAINVLMLGIAHQGIAFPILWMLLSKTGNSNTAERICLMDRFLSCFGVEKINFFTADREFLGKEWFSYLLEKLIAFRIRIRENMLISNARGILVPAKTLFRDLRVGEHKILEGKRKVLGIDLYVIGLLLPDGEYLILVTHKHPETALDDYAKRWGIETLFGAFKSRGFRFEETHMTDPERISKLIALMAIAFCWAHNTGEWLNDREPIEIKKHGRKAISLFRYGLDHLREMLLNINEKYQEFKDMVELLRTYLTGDPPPLTHQTNDQRDCQYILNQVEDTITLPMAA